MVFSEPLSIVLNAVNPGVHLLGIRQGEREISIGAEADTHAAALDYVEALMETGKFARVDIGSIGGDGGKISFDIKITSEPSI